MTSGSELVETWIPVGGFKVERRRVRTQDGGATVTECLVPKWEIDDLMEDYPCARQPCLHRLVADCSLEKAAVLDLAGRYGLLTVSLTRVPAPGKPVPSSTLSPEPLDIWKSEIRELKACADLWDRTAAGDRRGEEMLERKLGAGLARAPFHLAAAREKRIGLPDALPAREPARRSLAKVRRRSGRTYPLRPLPRAHMSPLVSQGRGLQKRSAVLLGYLPGPRVQDAER
jgi:hypothetical protein